MLEPHHAQIADFADAGRLLLSMTLADLWAKVFIR
jgi:hypothetical protein